MNRRLRCLLFLLLFFGALSIFVLSGSVKIDDLMIYTPYSRDVDNITTTDSDLQTTESGLGVNKYETGFNRSDVELSLSGVESKLSNVEVESEIKPTSIPQQKSELNISKSRLVKSPPITRNGRFRGSTGQHRFFHTKTRDWFVEPEIVNRMCQDTNYTQCFPPIKRTEQQKEEDRAVHDPFRVAVYQPFPWEPWDPYFTGCDYDNCIYAGRTITPQADAVFVYGVGLNEDTPLPSVRLPHQVFIFATWEPPAYRSSSAYSVATSKWRTFFNATNTYRRDADIRHSYGKLDFQFKQEKVLPDYRAIARQKTRTAVWMVSECGRLQSDRNSYVREMQKYITVDVFGKCGEACEMNDEQCVSDLSSTYSFYLAFENSYCTDYVTEKFFKFFIDDMHIIPVARGDLDYNKEFPAKTFVNAADFEGPKELALFLKSLEEDEVEYSKYLETKDRFRSINYGNRWCWVCEYLQKLHRLPESRRHRTVDLMKEFFQDHVHDPPPTS